MKRLMDLKDKYQYIILNEDINIIEPNTIYYNCYIHDCNIEAEINCVQLINCFLLRCKVDKDYINYIKCYYKDCNFLYDEIRVSIAHN